ncbi:MAG TPA: DUF72 domain-containing protein [Bdellovibrionales bacterium]|nr:DUF72 domain-containing protein [Bdellovibrionales bacterium]
MEFGKIDILGAGEIDLRLPPDDPRTWVALKRAKDRRGSSPTRVGVGAPVWGVREWIGKLYPVGTQPKDFLYHYARQFNSIELNATYYGTPDRETVSRWRDTTPNGFKFNVKMLQEVTHRGSLSSHSTKVLEFLASVLGLEDRLGFIFIQLPPSFGPEQLSELKAFLGLFPKDVNVAVEVRHPRLFQDHRLSPRLYDLLAEKNASTVITDVAGRRDVLHTSLPTGRLMVRFMGNDMHPSDETRIADWVSRLHTWQILGLEQIEFFIHQPENRSAPELINRFIDRMNSECGTSLMKWQSARAVEPQLGLL